jgi:hypothetical protein
MSSVVDVSSVASSLEQYRLRTQRKNRIARKEKAKYVRPSRAEASLAAVNAARLAERRGDRHSLRCMDAKKAARERKKIDAQETKEREKVAGVLAASKKAAAIEERKKQKVAIASEKAAAVEKRNREKVAIASKKAAAVEKRKQKAARKQKGAMAAARARREVARQAKRAAVLETRRVASKLARDLLKGEAANRYAMRMDMTEVELLAVLECDGVDLDEMFADSDRDLGKVLMLYYINSGYLSFDNHREYMSSYSGVPVDVERIVSQVKQERLTEGERDTKVFRFYNRHSYTEANLFACSACGYRVREQQTDPELLYKCVDLDSDCMSVLLFTQEQECVF